MNLNIPLDKKTHFLAGFSIAAVSLPLGLLAAFFIAAAIGLLKEVVYDKLTGGDVDAMDFVWTVAGAVAFIIWTLSFRLL